MEEAAETLEGVLERIVFVNEDETFVVARVRPDDGEPGTAVGRLGGLREGERVRLLGRTVLDPRWGPQFKVSLGYPVPPATLEGVRAYLASGKVHGIGKALAGRLVEAFGEETLQVIEEDPKRLCEVEGIGPKRSRELHRAFKDQKGRREALVFLQGHGVKPAMAEHIWRRYDTETVALVRENPYRLAEEIRGVGFRTADGIARALGFEADSPIRAVAGLVHLMAAAGDEGHVFLPPELLLERAERLLGHRPEAELSTLLDEERLIEDGGIYLRRTHALEREAAERVAALAREPVAELTLPFDLDLGLDLAPAQRAALELAASSGVMILTGGPGTGKTTIVRALLGLLRQSEGKVALAAPTGRAARRMSEATGATASTLHRLLEYNPAEGGFRKDEEDPIEASAVVIDEASMVDQVLFVALLRALKPGTRLILVGDADQLPSVGAGNVLGDLLASGHLPAARLTEIFRQAECSRIVMTAHGILGGRLPTAPEAGVESDFYLVRARDGEHAAELVCELVAERIPKRFGLDPMADIQVLAPMHRGRAGARSLNELLQERLNPRGEQLGRFRVGDKVMQIRNDYEREIFNGDIGRALHNHEGALRVRFEGRDVECEGPALDNLVLAYACSVHKSQGSEYPAVVVPVLNEHWVMLQRNLLYTALTRGRKLVVLVAQPKALQRAVYNREGLLRHTGLARRLRPQ